MKPLYLITAIIIFMVGCGNDAFSQRHSNATTTMKFCNVPLGIDTEVFKARVCTESMRDSLAELVGASMCVIYHPNLSIPYPQRLRTVCSAGVTFGGDYGTWIIQGFELLRNILTAKYGEPSYETTDRDGKPLLVWVMDYGEVTLKRDHEEATIKYVDYAALKQELPLLFKML